jgi:hypothetical protein
MVTCLQCGFELPPASHGGGSVPSIAGSIMGDEHIDSYYYCARCNAYTVEVYHEPFLGDPEVSFRGPISREQGDAAVTLISQCAEPWDKKCRCLAHRTYFHGCLD